MLGMEYCINPLQKRNIGLIIFNYSFSIIIMKIKKLTNNQKRTNACKLLLS